jgi:type VI secretion system protein ImpF
MARVEADQPLIPSVLDRLLDDEPTLTREPPKTRNQVLRELKQSIRRDLENLLNTRRRGSGWPENLEELERSLVNYGIPDITGASLGSDQSRRQFAQVVQRVIRQSEPRFQSLEVEVLDNAEPLDRTLRFRIDALLYAEPAPEPVVFDSAVQPATGNVEVKGTSR